MRRLVVALAFVAACKSGQPVDAGVVEAGTQAGGDLCSFIFGVADNGADRSICATIEEIVGVAIPFILDLRKASDAGPPALASCEYLPGTTFCATSAERADAILAITRSRQARVTREAGAP